VVASTWQVQELAGALSVAVDAVVAVPVAECGPEQLQAGIAAVSGHSGRLAGWLSAAAGQLAALTGGRVGTEDGRGRSVAGWLAETTGTSAEAAGSRLRTAAALRSLPLVVAAVLDGVLSAEQAAVLARLVGKIPDGQLQECQAELVQLAAGRDPVALGWWVRHQIATFCEPQLEADQAAAHAGRYLQTSRGHDGSLKGRFSLAAGDGEAVLTALEALAGKQGQSDTRSAGQRRADALAELAEQALRFGALPDHGGHRPQLSYVLPADWAARQAERTSCPTCSSCPAHRPVSFADTVLASHPSTSTSTSTSPGSTSTSPGSSSSPGGGTGAGGRRDPGRAVPAEHACATAAWTGPATRARIEALLCAARISRVLLSPLGQVTGLESLTDTVTARQRRALAARDLGCAARGCTRPPAMCDAHHLTALADGGPTVLDNLVLLCRRHHVLWHLGKITLPDLHVPWHPDLAGADPPVA
jgi:hypothetical protein